MLYFSEKEPTDWVGRTEKNNPKGDRSNFLLAFQDQPHSGRVVHYAIPQRWRQSVPDIGNKNRRLDYFLLG